MNLVQYFRTLFKKISKLKINKLDQRPFYQVLIVKVFHGQKFKKMVIFGEMDDE